MKLSDLRDILVFIAVANIQICSTVFLFHHADGINFATWAGVCGTLTAAYHWMCVRDDKEKDAC
jgi:hypothetical protein